VIIKKLLAKKAFGLWLLAKTKSKTFWPRIHANKRELMLKAKPKSKATAKAIYANLTSKADSSRAARNDKSFDSRSFACIRG